MPLVRYEIRNEHTLANPQLYRNASRDDPEALLEGVAMAGLVGIVRQLGDLAEFAAEIFRDLHEEVMATAARGHELLSRVQQLEAEVPAVEKALLSETNQLRFAYTAGAEWHASIRNDQNHCTQGDLPRFIRNSYEECRGPPRLFLLDKFDVAGAGACLKRYTDPSFFKTEWASSELMKAERAQREKKARREKKKGRRRRNDGKEAIHVDQLSRFSRELTPRFSKELIPHDQVNPRMWQSSLASKSEGSTEKTSKIAPCAPLAYLPTIATGNTTQGAMKIVEGASLNVISDSEALPKLAPKRLREYVEESSKEVKVEGPSGKFGQSEQAGQLKSGFPEVGEPQGVTDGLDDGASDYDHFVDALATMDPDNDSDSESRAKHGSDADLDRFPNGQKAPSIENMSHLEKCLRIPVPAQEEQVSPGQESEGYLPASSDQISRISATQKPNLYTNASLGTNEDVADIGLSQLSNLGVDTQSSSFSGKFNNSSSNPFDPLEKEEGARQGGGVFHGAATLNKIVADFERMSSEDTGCKEAQMEPDMGLIPSPPVSWTEFPPAAGLTCSVGVVSDIDSGSPSLQNSPRTLTASHSPHPYGRSSLIWQSSPSNPRIDIDMSSPLASIKSMRYLGSPPGSPIFSALHSPMSPVSASRKYTSLPDSSLQLDLSRELLSPSSPTAIPTLSLSPTSSQLPPPPPLPPLEWRAIRTSQNSTPKSDSPPACPPPSVARTLNVGELSESLCMSDSTLATETLMPELSLKDMSELSPIPMPPETGYELKGPSSSSTISHPCTLTSYKLPLDGSLVQTPLVKHVPDYPPPLVPSKTTEDLTSPPPPLKTASDFPQEAQLKISLATSVPVRYGHELPPPPPPPFRTLHELPPPPLPSRTPGELPPLQVPSRVLVGDVQEALLEAITSHDKSMLKKVKTMQNSTRSQGDERDVLLQQIRAKSFSLRRTVVGKSENPPRPVTNINVAAILEKANAIRQAFAGSDEEEDDDDDDDDWSDV